MSLMLPCNTDLDFLLRLGSMIVVQCIRLLDLLIHYVTGSKHLNQNVLFAAMRFGS